jgi:hypothetical protein
MIFPSGVATGGYQCVVVTVQCCCIRDSSCPMPMQSNAMLPGSCYLRKSEQDGVCRSWYRIDDGLRIRSRVGDTRPQEASLLHRVLWLEGAVETPIAF